MLRHHHVSDQPEPMSLPQFFKDLHEPIPCPRGPKQRSAAVTTESNKVQVPLPVVPFERMAFQLHRTDTQGKTRTLKLEGCGTPLEASAIYTSGMLNECARIKKEIYCLSATRPSDP